MLIDWMSTWTLAGWSRLLISLAVIGAFGSFPIALGITTGKGVLGFLGADRSPKVIIVQGSGQLTLPPEKRRWGFGHWYLLSLAILSGGPMLILLIMGVTHAFWVGASWVGAHWWLLLIGPAAFLIFAAVWWAIHRDPEQPAIEVQQIVPQPVAVESAPIWSMPEVEGNWAERRP